jgi:hypothetical protein
MVALRPTGPVTTIAGSVISSPPGFAWCTASVPPGDGRPDLAVARDACSSLSLRTTGSEAVGPWSGLTIVLRLTEWRSGNQWPRSGDGELGIGIATSRPE